MRTNSGTEVEANCVSRCASSCRGGVDRLLDRIFKFRPGDGDDRVNRLADRSSRPRTRPRSISAEDLVEDSILASSALSSSTVQSLLYFPDSLRRSFKRFAKVRAAPAGHDNLFDQQRIEVRTAEVVIAFMIDDGQSSSTIRTRATSNVPPPKSYTSHWLLRSSVDLLALA